MDLQKVIVSDMDLPVFQKPLCFLYHTVKVFTLVYVIGPEPVLFQVLDKVLRGIAVVSHHKRKYFILFHKPGQPFETVVIVHEVVSGCLEQSALDICVVRKPVPLCCFVDPLRRKEELRKHIQFPALLDHD